MILRYKGPGNEWREAKIKSLDGVPALGAIIDNGGQYFHSVKHIEWRRTGLLGGRIEAVVTLVEHDRADPDV